MNEKLGKARTGDVSGPCLLLVEAIEKTEDTGVSPLRALRFGRDDGGQVLRLGHAGELLCVQATASAVPRFTCSQEWR